MIKRMIFTLVFLAIGTIAYATSCLDCHANPPVKVNELAVKKAQSFLYVREANNNNRSKEIDAMHTYHGLGFGSPWCQMFTNYSYYLAFQEIGGKNPFPRNARVCLFAKWCDGHPLIVKVFSTKKMIWGVDKIEVGDVLTFKHGLAGNYQVYDWDGHAALVDSESTKKDWINTIEGNTKPTDKGDQTGKSKDTLYGKDGVYKRQRPIGLSGKFPIVQINRLQKRNY